MTSLLKITKQEWEYVNQLINQGINDKNVPLKINKKKHDGINHSFIVFREKVNGKISYRPIAMDNGKYLGIGGFGKVKVGEDQHGNNIAIKIQSSTTHDPDEFKRLKMLEKAYFTELTRIKKSENTYDKTLGKDIGPKKTYTALELIEGNDLTNEVYNKAPKLLLTLIKTFSPPKKRTYYKRLANNIFSSIPILGQKRKPAGLRLAIAYKSIESIDKLHKKGLLHLDIKPHNFMMNKKGEIIPIDFGLSKILQEGKKHIKDIDIRNDGFGGTYGYKAPEIETMISEMYTAQDYYNELSHSNEYEKILENINEEYENIDLALYSIKEEISDYSKIINLGIEANNKNTAIDSKTLEKLKLCISDDISYSQNLKHIEKIISDKEVMKSIAKDENRYNDPFSSNKELTIIDSLISLKLEIESYLIKKDEIKDKKKYKDLKEIPTYLLNNNKDLNFVNKYKEASSSLIKKLDEVKKSYNPKIDVYALGYMLKNDLGLGHVPVVKEMLNIDPNKRPSTRKAMRKLNQYMYKNYPKSSRKYGIKKYIKIKSSNKNKSNLKSRLSKISDSFRKTESLAGIKKSKSINTMIKNSKAQKLTSPSLKKKKLTPPSLRKI